MSDDKQFVVGMPEALRTGLIQGTIQKQCCNCGKPTWYSEATMQHPIAKQLKTRFICLLCTRINDDTIVMPLTESQLDEIKRALK